MTFRDHIERLFRGRDVSPPLADVHVIVVMSSDFDSRGRVRVSRSCVVPGDSFESEFIDILSRGYSWVNLSHYGSLEGRELVCVELPRESTGQSRTSVNVSGPSKLVLEAGGDAGVLVKFTEEDDT